MAIDDTAIAGAAPGRRQPYMDEPWFGVLLAACAQHGVRQVASMLGYSDHRGIYSVRSGSTRHSVRPLARRVMARFGLDSLPAGSDPTELLQLIERAGSIRSPELARKSGLSQAQVEAALARRVQDGTLVACTVLRAGQAMQEYRVVGGKLGHAGKFDVPILATPERVRTMERGHV